MNHWLNEGKEIMKKNSEKHPYYDSDRKKQLESDSLKAIFYICSSLLYDRASLN